MMFSIIIFHIFLGSWKNEFNFENIMKFNSKIVMEFKHKNEIYLLFDHSFHNLPH